MKALVTAARCSVFSGHLTSLLGLKLFVPAGGPLSSAVKHPDIEGIVTIWMQAGQLAVCSVPIEGEDLLLGMVWIVIVPTPLPRIVNLQHRCRHKAGSEIVKLDTRLLQIGTSQSHYYIEVVNSPYS